MNYFERERLANEVRVFALHLAAQQINAPEPRFLAAEASEDGESVHAFFFVNGWQHALKKPLTGTLEEIKNELIRLTIYPPAPDELEPVRPREVDTQDCWDLVGQKFGIRRGTAEVVE